MDAIVAWDNLSRPSPGTGGTMSFPSGEAGCPAHPEDRIDLTEELAKAGKPALGMSADSPPADAEHLGAAQPEPMSRRRGGL